MNVQYINDKNGETQFVILPIEEYRRLTGDDNDDEWEEVPYEAIEFDDVSLPFAIADIMTGRDVSAIAAWRIHRGLTQAQAAEKAGIKESYSVKVLRKEPSLSDELLKSLLTENARFYSIADLRVLHELLQLRSKKGYYVYTPVRAHWEE